jgi:hypothetical protein
MRCDRAAIAAAERAIRKLNPLAGRTHSETVSPLGSLTTVSGISTNVRRRRALPAAACAAVLVLMSARSRLVVRAGRLPGAGSGGGRRR